MEVFTNILAFRHYENKTTQSFLLLSFNFLLKFLTRCKSYHESWKKNWPFMEFLLFLDALFKHTHADYLHIHTKIIQIHTRTHSHAHINTHTITYTHTL